jgi:Phosphotransferase enzyme family
MVNFVLDSQNILPYLQQWGLLAVDPPTVALQQLSAKNFNILISAPTIQPLLVKQARISSGQQTDELYREWRLQELIATNPQLVHLATFLPKVLHCDRSNGIVVNHFWTPYSDLQDYYDTQHRYPPAIAIAIGQCLGQVHRSSFNPQLQPQVEMAMGTSLSLAQTCLERWQRLHTGIFAATPIDCLRFYKLYQQYPQLSNAVAQLAQESIACCLTHNDLKLNNILLHQNPASSSIPVRIIDWECAGWGDPAADLGMAIGSYLELWLENLVVGSELSIQESLQLAIVPLPSLQPSLLALVDSYLTTFPEILPAQPHYLQRVLQYTGLCLMRRIEAIIENNRFFNNQGIAILQVARKLLCHPLSFIQTIFGSNVHQIITA